ncbi:carnosine N-methyltransferase [Salvia divinorum]|uniref:Carnosine N-methyltransferase n=1 Tax=Salvia divinorum TaxID=28513 RepID=A0ABD1IFD2_SALDI
MSSIEDDEFRRRKLEEVLEVKSLRRIISAYLNYPEAAEEDFRRYERCFSKLPLSYKELLSHLPLEFQKVRCAGIIEGFSMCGGDFIEVYSDPSQVGGIANVGNQYMSSYWSLGCSCDLLLS